MEWIKRFAYLLIVLLMIGTIVVAGCNNNQATRNDYQKAVQTLVNYRNQIVKGAIKQNNSALKEFITYLGTTETNVQDSGPKNVRRNSDEEKLLVEKGYIIDLLSKARELAYHLPPVGQTNQLLDDFDAYVKQIARTYSIPIQLAPI